MGFDDDKQKAAGAGTVGGAAVGGIAGGAAAGAAAGGMTGPVGAAVGAAVGAGAGALSGRAAADADMTTGGRTAHTTVIGAFDDEIQAQRAMDDLAAAGFDRAAAVIVRCDADTRPPTDWLARIGAAFDAEPGLDALTGPGRFYDLPRPVARLASAAYGSGYRLGAGLAMAATPVWGSNFAIRRTAWERARAGIHRDRQDIHDDLDLSFQLAPWARIRFDRRLRVGAAGRIFAGRAAFARRFRWAFTTVAVNWAVQPPGQRWLRRLNVRTPERRSPASEGSAGSA